MSFHGQSSGLADTPGAGEWLEARSFYERRRGSSWRFSLGRRPPADRATPDAIWHLGIKRSTVQQHPQGPFPNTHFVPMLFCDGSNTSY